MDKSEKHCLYIEALPLTTQRISGIGHTLASIVDYLSADKDFTNRYDIILFGPKSGKAKIDKWNFSNITYKSQPVKQKIITGLNFLGLLPPVDLWLGKGTYLFCNFMNLPLTKNSKSLTYIHDVCYERFPEYVRPKVRQILKRNVPRWIKRTSKVIAVSEYTKQEIMHFYGTDNKKIAVVYNGVNHTNFYRRKAEEVETVKTKYGIKGRYILYLGNIEPRKNLQRLVLAVQGLPENLKSQYALLIVGGEGWLSQEINDAINVARQNGCNIIKPDQYVHDEDLPALFSGAAMLAHPAIYEGFGISPLQAMACGVPVLASKTTSLPEVVGGAGALVDPMSVEEIIAGIRKVLEDKNLQKEMIEKGYKRSREFEWSVTLRKLKELIDATSKS